ncbi:N-acetylmuramoyl-L-alanine amidase-like domain-containing protein [Flagellimonas meishanensis]|uniref:N-acetylmuramoyl-L-alanine amidase-like domain-containing protein n=1 Tax=Flagellimonas meishanensis TaxID=2873264 RepID=UPI001CA72C58|nr:N-acetylmuramoyl-L-alanine amidase-like domain-containing protein [[Muricauda] meishanensis]
MKNRSILICLLWAVFVNGQHITCSPEDSVRFGAKMKTLEKINTSSLGDMIIQLGKSFMGTPYVEKTLEVGETETLVINFGGLDCTTFVENVLAFALTLKQEEGSFSHFTENLKTIRYRDGNLDGYPSRLHYFTDWIRNNEKKGIVRDITSELGGTELKKAINFMGTHRNLYPFLANDANFTAMQAVERELAEETLCILPKDQIEKQEHLIYSGDIIALATSIKGLDVTHTGIAIQHKGRLHLLHASSKNGEVEITEEPLADYLKGIKSNIGIIVARPTF